METKRNPHDVPEQEAARQNPAKRLVKKPDMGDAFLSDGQIRELKERYNLNCMTCEEEETLLQDLNKMGILTNEDCGAFVKSGGNILEALTRQISANINLLYQKAIAGRDGNSHVEHIRSQQKLLDVLEQIAE
jgi:hypothetical protein